MKRPIREGCALAIALPVFLAASCSLVLPTSDNRARQNVLRLVAAEVPPHASMSQMEQFMMRHAPGRYSYDELNAEWQGLLPQSSFDRAFFDRQVGVYLKVDKKTGTFRASEAQVYYTFL